MAINYLYNKKFMGVLQIFTEDIQELYFLTFRFVITETGSKRELIMMGLRQLRPDESPIESLNAKNHAAAGSAFVWPARQRQPEAS